MAKRLNFLDTKTAFRHKTDLDLLRAKLLFSSMQKSYIVQIGKLASLLAKRIKLPLGLFLKPTIYQQFVGGETLEACLPTLRRQAKRSVRAVMDYSVEGGGSEAEVEANFQEVVASFHFAAAHPDLISHVVFKVSALASVEVMIRSREDPESLLPFEKQIMTNLRERFHSLCALASSLGLRVLVDAEHYAYQDLVDELCWEAVENFNKDRAVVFHTLQMYRKDRLAFLQNLFRLTQEKDLYLGIKFVRGAYMEEERGRAAEYGYPDPICEDKTATDNNYDTAVSFAVEHLDRFELVCGTHNEESIHSLIELMEAHNIDRTDERIYFAQLYGMSDNISYQLSEHAYNVTKYLPYAAPAEVLPYLIRRAEENTAIAGQSSRELKLIKREINRRRRVFAAKKKDAKI